MKFVPIIDENRRFVDTIHGGTHADAWVHVNGYWLDNSEGLENVETRLIYLDGAAEPVGFVAFGQHFADEDLEQPVDGVGEVIHLIIDESCQSQGYGRQATLLCVELLTSDARYRRVVIAHHPDNVVAQRLYESLGFVKVGENYDGDALLELNRESRTRC